MHIKILLGIRIVEASRHLTHLSYYH